MFRGTEEGICKQSEINEMEEIQFFQAEESTKDFLDVFVKFTFYIYEIPATWRVLIMQGIDHLDFRPDKFGNQDIVGMVSAQEEVVTFSNIIYPVDAKGMVEKWLLQVEKQMIKSLRDTIEKAMGSYYTTPLTNWVLDWAGQVGNIVSVLTRSATNKHFSIFYI